MDTESVLLDLVTSEYRLRNPRLQALAERTRPGWAGFHVLCEDDMSFVLHAVHEPRNEGLIPDSERIAAVLDGSTEHYRLNGQDLSDLPDAVTFDPSRRLARLVLDRDTRPNDGLLRTLVSRIAAGPRLADVARAALDHR